MILTFKNFILIPEFFFCVSLICLLLYGTILSSTLKINKLILKSFINLSILILFYLFILFINNINSFDLYISSFLNTIIVDYFSEFSKIFITVCTFFCFCLFRLYLPIQKIHNFEYIVILLLSILGVFLLCSANDLLTSYLAIELQSLAFYILSSFKKKSSFSINAGLKYFILGAIASCLFLFSSSLIYGLTGSINLEEIFQMLNINSFFGFLSCFHLFFKQMFYLNSFGFYYSFDTNFEDMILDLYFCFLEFFLTFDFNIDFLIESHFENFIININKWFYYSYFFNFEICLKKIYFFILFILEHYYFLNTFHTYLLLHYTDFFQLFSYNLFFSLKNFFFSIFYFSFFLFLDLKNFFFSQFFEFHFLVLNIFINFSFLNVFLIDLIINEVFVNFYFVLLDTFFFYSQFFHLFHPTILFFLLYILLFSLFFKLAVIPFNLWLPDIYENSISSTTAFFTIIPKLSIFVFFFRLLDYGLLNNSLTFQYYIVISGVVSILYGSFIAIEEKKLKSLISFSAISNIGFILIAFSSFNNSSNAMVFCYFIIYMFTNLLIWFIILTYNSKIFIKSNKYNKEISNFSNFYKSNKIMSFLFSFILFSIAGIPPFLGFLAKFGIFFTIIQSFNYSISVISILGSIVAIFYYLRIIKLIFFENCDNRILLYMPINSFFVFFFLGFLLLLILIFVDPTFIYLIFFKLSYTFL